MATPLQPPNRKRSKFQFQKLYGPEISRLLPRMLQFFENFWQLFIFSNYIREIDHFTLELLKRSDT